MMERDERRGHNCRDPKVTGERGEGYRGKKGRKLIRAHRKEPEHNLHPHTLK